MTELSNVDVENDSITSGSRTSANVVSIRTTHPYVAIAVDPSDSIPVSLFLKPVPIWINLDTAEIAIELVHGARCGAVRCGAGRGGAGQGGTESTEAKKQSQYFVKRAQTLSP